MFFSQKETGLKVAATNKSIEVNYEMHIPDSFLIYKQVPCDPDQYYDKKYIVQLCWRKHIERCILKEKKKRNFYLQYIFTNTWNNITPENFWMKNAKSK